MCGSQVLRTMERCSIFKLLLFQIIVAWSNAKHVTDAFAVEYPAGAVDREVQDSIRNLIHTGIYSHRHMDPSQVQVVTPVKVTREGALVSHAVEHAHEHGHARARRDLHAREHELQHSVHYNLTIDGKELRLDLRPSVTFITPAMFVERHTASGRTREAPNLAATACHFTGSIRGQPASNIALSACDGLAGHLRTEFGEYWIEPSNQISDDNSVGRPHVVFKRSAVDKVQAYHRAKRDIHNKPNPNPQYNRPNYNRNTPNLRQNINTRRNVQSRESMERRRNNFMRIEARRRRLEELRKNPTAYRIHHDKLPLEQRRMHSASRSQSRETSEQTSAGRGRSRPRLSNEERIRRRNRRRKHKRSKNCATRQPPYQWRKENYSKYHQHPNHTSVAGESRRATRSVSKPRHVEVLLVADQSMTEFHEKEKLEGYLLTIMNMVSSLYMDSSIGNYIKVVVVKIILIEETRSKPALDVSSDADETLRNFCRWQQHLNPDGDENPNHHDVAILITRQDICSQHDAPCSTLGVAHVAGMCKPDRSCSVNEDNGIMLAHTITHELGHNFGLYHDTEKIGCHRREGTTLHIMTPIFEADTRQVAWSRCSKRDVTNFLDAGLGECLSDKPSQEEYYQYPEDPAGVIFDAATQCLLQFGSEAVVCAKPAELCEHLWCLVNDTCKTMLRPAAPGTTCGPDMWCQNQTCVPRTPSPAPRDGGWGEWSEWSECSRTCGAGVSTQSRQCNNPEPINNGAYCIGDRSRYRICNTDPCPINEPSFREYQCSKYNNLTYKNVTVTEWIPYFDQDKPCELKCVPREENELFDDPMSEGFAADGTPCRQNPGARDMCISGVCYKVGCDWKVDSDLEDDVCGVCGGNGTKCKTVQGIYNKGTTRHAGLSEVAVIPAGSRNVKIEEKVSPGNYISIGSATSRKLYLTGARNATLTEYFVAGSQAIYERDRDWEKVRIQGPIREDIKVYQRICRGKHRNPGVTYQYTVDRQRQYRYRLTEWSPCSASCGVGYMSRHYECVDQDSHPTEQSNCYNREPPRNEALMQQCRRPACPTPQSSQIPDTPTASALYSHPPLSHPHSQALQVVSGQYPRRIPTRSYPQSQTQSPEAFHSHQLRGRPHPREHSRDHSQRPRYDWLVYLWKPCPKACHMPGEDVIKHRAVYCVDKVANSVVTESYCDQASRPSSTTKCRNIPPC
ncbi:A disintegrin and metalloproteinase with thrombospondin motifs 7 [Amyelois transitella]|uniref:A disintegrin and metalloproteinase with thrombospondin motifs 7 n=1 Tax=Amyelois transitella TaxID=680683 RepID=UPI00067E16CC|nr:A disintegrin and metalloproteinase with thrombospondin motifs 7 [Amyelois transitella]XP_060804444.1 A disintegrin and metalloproteinase with thrombospondin motifs 7 [Amyelois transitella]XP_060804445.1 A disintegrin and metalloproteinase with thrombospondin motifs 7 [Amyelois transitella]